MVDVQQRTLCAFKQDGDTGLVHVVQSTRHVCHHRLDALGQLHGIGQDVFIANRLGLEQIGQQEVVVLNVFLQLGGKTFRVEQVDHLQCATGYLVFVARADTAAGGTNLASAKGGFTRLVQCHVVRQDQRAAFGNLQAGRGIHASGFQLVDFLQQGFGRQHHAITDETFHAFTQNAGRNQAQHGFLAIHHQGMARIVTTLETYHSTCVVGQPVNDLALAFITPLGTDHDNILGHWKNLFFSQTKNQLNGTICQPSAAGISSRLQPMASADSPR